ncbi:hypothetical protein [Bacillus pseudomycoides]|uniref:hypothetical protein n=1 Tax=Bacillus pseudomycoides TaxID=64104 RepID=UPI000BEF86C5|nr:hypothetical protein [Bacillus pseudomycoides]PEM69312.1 hypothetical protein CN619_21490 [Bacillus pseudomycoides]PGA62223.1 hypothetical protein COL84_13715 [Bacillus pseudomycoides]
MSRLITSIKSTITLFRAPKRIGEIIEYQKRLYLIIGIEHFKIYGHQMSIWYTVQNLEKHDFISKQTEYPEHGLEEMYVQYKYDDKRFDSLQLGRTIPHKNEQYKVVEYTDIVLKGTDIEVSFLARKVIPINRKEAKTRYVAEKKKKLAIEIV